MVSFGGFDDMVYNFGDQCKRSRLACHPGQILVKVRQIGHC